MGYVIELPTGILAMTFEPSLLDIELPIVNPLKLAIPHGLPRGREYRPNDRPNARMWFIAADHAAIVQDLFRAAGAWLAWITRDGRHVFIPGPVPVTAPFELDEHEIYSYADWVSSINAGEPGKALAHMIRANTNLLEVLADHGSSALNPQIALDLSSADGQPAPRTKPRPKPPVEEAGDLPVAYIMRDDGHGINYAAHLNPRYRFSLVAEPNNFCGILKRDQLTVWAERTENANFERLRIPRSIDAQSHYTALAMKRVAGKYPTRAEARAAFAVQSLAYHPDHNKADNAAAMFAPVLAAWEFFNRATKDNTGRLFKMYEASLKVRNVEGEMPHPKMIEPVIDERLTAPYLSSNVMCGLLTGTWTRNLTTGEIIIKAIDDIKPLTDSVERIWFPIQNDALGVEGLWMTLDEYGTWPRPELTDRAKTQQQQSDYEGFGFHSNRY